MSFHWVVPPEEELIPGIEDYGNRMLVALQGVATYWGQKYLQDPGRINAPWHDRTANARSGLFFAVDGLGLNPITGTVTPDLWTDAFIAVDNEGRKWEVNRGRQDAITIESGDNNTLIIVFGHSVFYGKFLELSNGGRFAIIMSTIESNLPKLSSMLQDLFKG